ncbi:MAG TPA: hypothetical protein VMP03_14850 [Methylomirabilota bacterium]|nr:hypothetical protein [Methylomirabilota bacterium]
MTDLRATERFPYLIVAVATQAQPCLEPLLQVAPHEERRRPRLIRDPVEHHRRSESASLEWSALRQAENPVMDAAEPSKLGMDGLEVVDIVRHEDAAELDCAIEDGVVIGAAWPRGQNGNGVEPTCPNLVDDGGPHVFVEQHRRRRHQAE